MQSTVRDRKTGEYKQIAPRRPRAKKTISEAYPESCVIAENILMLMTINRDTRESVADYLGISRKTMTERLACPWMFRLEELEAVAMRYDVTVRQLLSPMRFEEE